MEQLKFGVISGTVCLGAILVSCANSPSPHRPASRPLTPHLSQNEVCLRDVTRIGSGGDLCEPFENRPKQVDWDAGMKDGGWTPLDNDEMPDFGTPQSPPCPDAWAYIGDTTYYVCWDGRVTTS